MNALVLFADRDLRFVPDWPEPAPVGDRSVLLRVAAAGICGSDLERGFRGRAYRYPLVMGHEFGGIVEEVPAGSPLRPGDRVAVFPLLPCRRCGPCQTGDFAQCTAYDYFGSRRDGAFCERLHVPEANCFPAPDRVRTSHLAMVEPAAVALHGVRRMRVAPGDTGLVIGAGPIGNMVAQWLRIAGCVRVLVADVDPAKLAVARGMGFETVDSAAGDPVAAVRDLTGGEGVARVVEACGLPVTFLQAVQCAARFGEVVFMGNIHGTFQIGEQDFSGILRKELTILGTWNSKIAPAGRDDWSTVLAYLDGPLQVAPLISDTPPLAEGPEIFASILAKRRPHNKVVFEVAAG